MSETETVRTTTAGKITITKTAIEDLIRHSIPGSTGLKKIKPSIQIRNDGIAITVILVVDSRWERANPEMIQTGIKEALEQYTGIEVKEVNVLVKAAYFWSAFKR